MIYEAELTVQYIGRWSTDLGLKLPNSLTHKLTMHDEVGYLSDPDLSVDLEALTMENLEATVDSLAGDLSAAAKHKEAARRIRDGFTRGILREASSAVPDMIEQLRPGFEKAVADYVEAVSELPSDLTSDGLVKAGPEALAAFQAAQTAKATISAVDSWVAKLLELPKYVGKPDPVLRVLKPTTRDELSKLLTAHSKAGNALENQIGPLYFVAAKEGIEFTINTPQESEAIRAEIDAQPQPKRTGERWVSVR
ncbi:hypothetical protein CH256_17470 [Rhodococcus sp. 05-2254-6]|uniref:hypothetical protein n=1 Tax=Rhodococcus sp. 05-2254-6 TaxID=2022489 RepID=UPI000B9B6E16|nr:hypothetical protein [Rhodococcus sp. 05-2254-6]OZE26579.1 hypothetical protein CH256_17470 [Rhodococcus sp. 05-2254-6]